MQFDDFYVDAWGNFIRKFECAIAQIRYMKKGISFYTDDGSDYIKQCWRLNKSFNRIHPFSIILDGKFDKDANQSKTIQKMFGFAPKTIASCFYDGFADCPEYNDVWADCSWHTRAGFHIGRYLYNKNCSPKEPLTYSIPEHLLKLRDWKI